MDENINVSAVERVAKILDAVSQSQKPVGVTALSKQIGLPKATVFRFCNTLYNLGYLDKNVNDEFSLGLIFITLGERVKADTNIAELAKPYMEELSMETGESINLGIRQDNSVFTLLNVEGESSVLVSRLVPVCPLHCSSMGKVFLVNMKDKELREFFSSNLIKRTLNTITTYEDFQKAKEFYEENGVTSENEEYEYGLSCMAAPLYGYKGSLVAAISLSAPGSRMEIKGREYLMDRLKATADKISRLYARLYITK